MYRLIQHWAAICNKPFSFHSFSKQLNIRIDGPDLLSFLFFLSLAHCLATAPLKLRQYDAIQICILSLLAHFIPPTRTRQNCLVLSCPCRRCEVNWRQDKTVLSCLDPVLQLATVQYQIRRGLLKTVLTCRQFSSHRRHGQDKTVLSCPCRRCELGIIALIAAHGTLGQG